MKSAFLCRDRRAIGNATRDLKLGDQIVNRMYKEKSVLLIQRKPLMSVVDCIYQPGTLGKVDASSLYNGQIDSTGDILFMLGILVDTFNIDCRQHINCRLKYFAFRNILSLGKFDDEVEKTADLKKRLFSKMLYCHPTDENYRSQFCLKQDDSRRNYLCYQEVALDIKKVFNDYLEGLGNTSAVMEMFGYKRSDSDIIATVQSFINDMLDLFWVTS